MDKLEGSLAVSHCSLWVVSHMTEYQIHLRSSFPQWLLATVNRLTRITGHGALKGLIHYKWMDCYSLL